jgi:hypothetical protein
MIIISKVFIVITAAIRHGTAKCCLNIITAEKQQKKLLLWVTCQVYTKVLKNQKVIVLTHELKVTVAYMRDRGETGCKAIRDENTNELVRTADQSDGEYVYLFDCKKNKWYYLVTRVAMNNLRKGINAKPLRWYALNQKNTAEK